MKVLVLGEISGSFDVIKESKFNGYILDVNGTPTFVSKKYEVKDKWYPLIVHPFPNGSKVIIKREWDGKKYGEMEARICSGHINYHEKKVCIFHNGGCGIIGGYNCEINAGQLGYKYNFCAKGMIEGFKVKLID